MPASREKPKQHQSLPGLRFSNHHVEASKFLVMHYFIGLVLRVLVLVVLFFILHTHFINILLSVFNRE